MLSTHHGWDDADCPCIMQSIGNGIAPKILGDQLNLSPVVILLSLLFWGWLWGIIGMFLAVPISVIIKIIFENTGPRLNSNSDVFMLNTDVPIISEGIKSGVN